MKKDTEFWCGIGVGLVVGTTVGMMLSGKKEKMKTRMGKGIQKMGVAIDHKVDSIISNMR